MNFDWGHVSDEEEIDRRSNSNTAELHIRRTYEQPSPPFRLLELICISILTIFDMAIGFFFLFLSNASCHCANDQEWSSHCIKGFEIPIFIIGLILLIIGLIATRYTIEFWFQYIKKTFF